MSGQNEEEVVVVELEHSAEEIDAAIDDINIAKPQIEQALDDIDDLYSNMAPDYPDGGPYDAGDYCIHEGAFYRAKEAVAQGASWDESKWTLISIGEDLAKKANRDDYCPDFTAGNAEQIVSSIGVTDTDPYNYRTSGGTSDIGNRAEEKRLVGGTIAWNQLLRQNSAWSSRGLTYTPNSDGSFSLSGTVETAFDYNYVRLSDLIPFIRGTHKYIITTRNLGSYTVQVSGFSIPTTNPAVFSLDGSGVWTNSVGIRLPLGTTVNISNARINVFDLTLALGPSIADFIYAKEQAHAGDGVAWFRQYFPKDYYPYNAGNLMSVLLSRKEITKFNQFNKDSSSEWKSAYLDSQGVYIDNNPSTKSAIIRCFPNTKYYAMKSKGSRFTMASFSSYPKYGDKAVNGSVYVNTEGGHLIYTTGPNDNYLVVYFYNQNVDTGLTAQNIADTLNVNLSWDGSRDGEYEAYELIPYPLPNVELRGIWKLDANNKLYFDGDELTPSGSDNLKRRYGIVDLGTLTWELADSAYGENVFMSYSLSDIPTTSNFDNLICQKYLTVISSTAWSEFQDKTMKKANTSSVIAIKDSAYTDAATFKTAMSGVYLVYELAQPTLETAGDYTAIQTVDDFGTEEFVDTREVAIPVGHETMYQANVGGFAESMYARGNGSPEEFVIQEELEQGLSNKASIEDVFTHVMITDPATTLGDVKEMLDEINSNGEHVFFDTYALGANTYVCTILIDADNGIYKMFDVVGQRVTEGTYDADKLLVVVLANLDNIASQKQIDNLQEQIDELGGSSLIKDYAVLKQKIADGTSTDAVSPGDKIDINWIDTVTGSTNKGSTVTCSDEWQFAKGVGECEERQYLFVYDGSSWTYNEEQIALSDFGLSVTGTPSIGEVMTITATVKTVNFTFTGYDKSVPHSSDIHHNWTLEQTYAPDTRIYDTYECLFTLAAGKTLAAGSYKLTNYSHRSGANLTVYFTLSSAVSNSGSTVIQFASQGYTASGSYYIPSSMKAFQFASDTALTGAISISMTEIAGATDVSTVDGVVLPGSFDFAAFGNNNWALSNVRQHLNDESKTGTYTPSTNFDRPNVANRQKGWLYGIDPRAYDMIIGVDNKFTAGYGNDGYTQNRTYTSTDKVFLLSMKEMSFDVNAAEGEIMNLYGEYTNNTLTNGAVAARAKYNKAGGTLNSYRWSRSAYVSGAYYGRGVASSGAYDGYGACVAGYVAPAFCFGA